MAYTRMTEEEAAEYLHLDLPALRKLVNKRNIPFSNQGGQTSFRKNEIRDWLTTRLVEHPDLRDYHKKATKKREEPDRHKPFLSQFVEPSFMHCHIEGRSKKKIIKNIVSLAASTELLCDDDEFHELLNEREELCSTGMANGIAMPHTRIHSDFLFLENFLLIAKSSNGIPFGAVDGKMTDLFFIPCATDDRMHLYMITRLALMLQSTDLAEELRDADTEEEMYDAFTRCEQVFVETVVDKYN